MMDDVTGNILCQHIDQSVGYASENFLNDTTDYTISKQCKLNQYNKKNNGKFGQTIWDTTPLTCNE